MRVFISWSGARSSAIADALKTWLGALIPGLDFFHSADIEKGRHWFPDLVGALESCGAGLFCLTPEAMRSPWMLFEAGAIANRSDHPSVFSYLYGVTDVAGPFSHFQTTSHEKGDARHLAKALARLLGERAEKAALDSFEEAWPSFDRQVRQAALLPIEDLLPGFSALFRGRKTFHEPFPDCTDKRWDDRLRRTAQTIALLRHESYESVLISDPYLQGRYNNLMSALDRYDMNVGSTLLTKIDFESLDKAQQSRLERSRKQVVAAVAALEQSERPPVFEESLAFESERSHEVRKRQIVELEGLVRQDEIDVDRLDQASRSTAWALDRIMFYVGWRLRKLPESYLPDMVEAVRFEGLKASAREAMTGLQPLYYVVEALDERPPQSSEKRAELRRHLEQVRPFLEEEERLQRHKKTHGRVVSLIAQLGPPDS